MTQAETDKLLNDCIDNAMESARTPAMTAAEAARYEKNGDRAWDSIVSRQCFTQTPTSNLCRDALHWMVVGYTYALKTNATSADARQMRDRMRQGCTFMSSQSIPEFNCRSLAAVTGQKQPSAVAASPSTPSGPAGAGRPPTSPGSQAALGNRFDGVYFSPVWRYGFSVANGVGTATVSNSSVYKPGDVVLRFTATGPTTFIGQQICTDGKFYSVRGALTNDGALDIAINGCGSPGWFTVKMMRTVSGQNG